MHIKCVCVYTLLVSAVTVYVYVSDTRRCMREKTAMLRENKRNRTNQVVGTYSNMCKMLGICTYVCLSASTTQYNTGNTMHHTYLVLLALSVVQYQRPVLRLTGVQHSSCTLTCSKIDAVTIRCRHTVCCYL